ncbi:head GIN domain-containing protein [Mucilaginibacter sp. AW1-3]
MKSLTRVLFATVVVALINVSAKAANTDDRHLTGFNAVNLSASFDVYITQGPAESVKVEAPAEDLEHIVTEVRGGVLNIYEKSHSSGMPLIGKKRVIYVVAKDLNSITVNGSGDVFFKSGINTKAMKIKVSGSGDITGNLTVKTLDAAISGSGDVKLAGHADGSTVLVSGSGDFSGRDLVTNNTTVKVMGSGNATVNANVKIDAAVSGSGDIRYTGATKQVAISKAGSGDVHKL